MAKSYVNVSNGNVYEIIEINDYIETEFQRRRIYYDKERLTTDRNWIHNALKKYPFVRFIRVVKVKPEGGSFVKRRYYFDAFLVKRIPRGMVNKVWMLYLVIP